MLMTHDEMIEVINAHREGKQIQFLCTVDQWLDIPCEDVLFNFHYYKYRVKPQPKVTYVNLYDDGFGPSFGITHKRKEQARFGKTADVNYIHTVERTELDGKVTYKVLNL